MKHNRAIWGFDIEVYDGILFQFYKLIMQIENLALDSFICMSYIIKLDH